MPRRERNVNLHIFLNAEEYDLLKRKTELSKLNNMSEYVRHLIINGITYEIDYSELHRYNYLLSNLTNNLNQIAHQANASGHATNNDLKKAEEIMEEVWQLQRSMLSDLRYRNL